MQLIHFSIIFLFIIPTWSRLPPDDSSCNHHCFHQPPEACPPPESTCRCRQLPNCQKAAICCNVNNFTLKEGLACANISSNIEIESLHIRNATFESFNLNLSQTVWRILKYMTLTDGNISRIDGEFAKHSRVSCLNLSSNHINAIEDRALGNLFNLSILDLSHNNLTEVPSIRKESVTLDMSNNTNLICANLRNTLTTHPEVNFISENQTFCKTTQDLDWWYDTNTNVPLPQVKAVHDLQKNCHHNCTCKTFRLNLQPGKLPTFDVQMNCSGKSFLSLPVPLPDNTIVLDVSNNNITSLKELSDPSYQNLRNFFADNNQISSIQPLEGTKFISTFYVLSLQKNKFKSLIPTGTSGRSGLIYTIFRKSLSPQLQNLKFCMQLETYVLDNIQFERSLNERQIRLGFNKLHCDCNTMKLKIWLLSKLNKVPDHNDIRCDNMNMKVIELDASKLCQSPQDWTDFIYYIITAEVLLLVGLVAKVSYDYWVFKTAGYLPWPASKMPRLPCDWLCE